MQDRGGRVMLGVALLALIWIGTYWVWQPGVVGPSPKISFADEPAPATTPSAIEGPALLSDAPAQSEPQPEQPEPEPAPAAPTTVVEPPQFRDYTVRSGDTLERIAQRELGRRSYWTAIAESNPLRDPRRLRPGDVIRIPIDPTNIQGREVEVPASDPQPDPGPDPDTDPPSDPQPDPEPSEPEVEPETPADGIARYVVVEGDTLASIAQDRYGDPGFAEFIFFHNRDVLDSPDALTAGDVLKLPELEPEPAP